MRPIDLRIDTSLCQALTCADLRFPKRTKLSRPLLELAVSLRFALIGISATHYLLSECTNKEKVLLIPELRFFGTMIREHLETYSGVDSENSTRWVAESTPQAGQAAYVTLFDRYIDLQAMHCPLDLSLSILAEDFIQTHLKELQPKFWIPSRRRARKVFETEAQMSMRYAIYFCERRKFDLEEVPEIALLGE